MEINVSKMIEMKNKKNKIKNWNNKNKDKNKIKSKFEDSNLLFNLNNNLKLFEQ